jgi:hypothetical protein
VNDNPTFTPGPWRSEGPDEFGDHNIIPPDARLAVAAVVSNLRPTEEVAANARLVAAAPELYDLVKEMLGCLDEVMVERHDSGGLAALGITHDDEGCSLCKARRVLAKAEGRS